MTNFFATIFLLLSCFQVHAKCTEEQKNAELEITYEYRDVSNIIIIKALNLSEGLELKKIILSDGGILDTPKYKLPIAFEVSDGIASIELEMNLDMIGEHNINFYYSGKECSRSISKLIGG